MSLTSTLANLSIRNKIIAAFLPLILLMGVLGTTSIQKFAQMNGNAEELTTNYMLGIGYLSEMRGAVMHYRLDILKGVLSRTGGDNAAALQKRLDGWLATLDANEAKYAPTVETGEETQLYGAYQAAWKEYLATAQQVLGHLLNNRTDEAVALLDPLFEKGERAVNALGPIPSSIPEWRTTWPRRRSIATGPAASSC